MQVAEWQSVQTTEETNRRWRAPTVLCVSCFCQELICPCLDAGRARGDCSSRGPPLGTVGSRWALAVGTVWIKVRGDRDQVGRPGSRGNGLWERAVPRSPPHSRWALFPCLVELPGPGTEVQKYRSTSTLPPPQQPPPPCVDVNLLPARPFSFSARGRGVGVEDGLQEETCSPCPDTTPHQTTPHHTPTLNTV